MTKTQYLEREEKQNFMDLMSWPDHLILSITEGFAPFLISKMSRRSYRSYRRDTPNGDLRNLDVELRRRGTLGLPAGQLMRDVDPQDRKLLPESIQLCYKSAQDLDHRDEFEVAENIKRRKTIRRLDRQAGGKLTAAFRQAGTTPSQIVNKAIFDIERLYFETRFDIAPDGELMKNKTSHTAKIIVALCLDAGDVLSDASGMLLVIDQMSTQVEREIKRKQCPHEGASSHLTSVTASPVQIESAMQHSLNVLRESIPTSVWKTVVKATESKSTEADRKTAAYEAQLYAPVFKLAA